MLMIGPSQPLPKCAGCVMPYMLEAWVFPTQDHQIIYVNRGQKGFGGSRNPRNESLKKSDMQTNLGRQGMNIQQRY